MDDERKSCITWSRRAVRVRARHGRAGGLAETDELDVRSIESARTSACAGARSSRRSECCGSGRVQSASDRLGDDRAEHVVLEVRARGVEGARERRGRVIEPQLASTRDGPEPEGLTRA
jgi:hypothetical protein